MKDGKVFVFIVEVAALAALCWSTFLIIGIMTI